jgi:hypothetical protein
VGHNESLCCIPCNSFLEPQVSNFYLDVKVYCDLGIEHGNPDLPVHVGRNIPLGGQFESNIPNISHDDFVPPPFDLPVGINSIGQIPKCILRPT